MENIENIPLPQKVKVSKEVLFQEIEGESVLLNLTNEQYFGLDEVGTRIWHLLTEDGEIDKTLRCLLKEYDVEEEKLRNDLSVLINELNAQGLITMKN